MKKLLLAMLFLTLGLAFTSNAYSQAAKVNVTNNMELTKALENPNVTHVVIAQDGYYEAISNNAFVGDVIVKNGNGTRSNCTLSITRDNECWGDAATQHFATAATSGDPSCPTQPSTGAYGWSAVTAEGTGVLSFVYGGTMTNQYDYDAVFTTTAAGKFTLTYKWNETDETSINVFLYDTPQLTNIVVEDGCEETEFTWTYDFGVQTGVTPLTVSYTITDGSSNTITGTVDPPYVDGQPGSFNFDPLGFPSLDECGEYTVVFSAYNSADPPCLWESDPYDFYIYSVPGASAGMDQEVCQETGGAFTTTLSGSYTGTTCNNSVTPTVLWALESGPGTAEFSDSGADMTTVTVTACGSYEFSYTVTNGLCESVSTTMVYFYDLPANVDAGVDQEVCEDETDGYMASITGTYDALSCTNGETEVVAWSKISGPGTLTFADASAASTTVTASACGSYDIMFSVTNGGDCTVTDLLTIDFYALPTNVTITADEKVCGFTSTLLGDYSQLCDELGENTLTWALVSGPGTAQFSSTSVTNTTVTVTTCGEYTFSFTVANITGCETVSTTSVTYYEEPDPVIVGDDEVFACSTVEYTVTETTCNDPSIMVYTWTVTGGVFQSNSLTTITATTVNVVWDNDFDTPGTLNVEARIDPLLSSCITDAEEMVVDKLQPTLEGQVKYWNEFETYMPSPFPTDNYSTYPQDYFYVTLYSSGTVKGSGMDSIATAIVQPNLLLSSTGTDSTLMSYFGFDLPVDSNELGGCNVQYYLKVWDGGLVYHTDPLPPAENTVLGNTYTWNNWGGVNATDAYAIQLMAAGSNLNTSYPWVGLYSDVPSYGYYSNDIGDVNNSGPGVTALDALIATYRGVGILSNYPDAGSNMFAPNFAVTGRMVSTLPEITWDTYFDCAVAKYVGCSDIQFTHSENEYMYFQQAINHKYTSTTIPWEADSNYINLYYEAEGDINASLVPTSGGFKAESALELVVENQVGTSVDQVMTIPISVDRDAELNAISLFMTFRNDLIEVIETNFSSDLVNINNEEGILNIGWFNIESNDVVADEAIALIKVRVLEEIPANTELFTLQANTELADASATAITDVTLKTIGVTTDKVQNTSELMASNYPNPFNNSTTIAYTLPESGTVKIAVLNSMGSVVEVLVEEVQEAGAHSTVYNTELKPGVYFYSIILQGEENTYSTVKRMIVVH